MFTSKYNNMLIVDKVKMLDDMIARDRASALRKMVGKDLGRIRGNK